MEYSMSQYSMLSKMSGGLYVDWWMTAPEEWEVIEYLEKEGLCAVTGDRSFGTWTLTQEGRRILEAKEQDCKNRAADDAEKDRNAIQRIKDRKQDRRDKWLGIMISCLLASVFTLCLEHFHEILVFLSDLFH